MADHKSAILPHDAARIDITVPHEIDYWSRKFDCTPKELMQIIKRVGVSSRAVENELRGGSKRTVSRGATLRSNS